jgi:hypothetical protein
MALRAIQRHSLLDVGSQMESLERNVNQWSQQRKRKKQRNEEEHWDLKQGKKDLEQESLKQEFTQVEQMLVQHFPELLSRIQHASSALFMEINRGFFLPFCTVALSALARVRTLILQMGRLGLTQLKELQSIENMSFFAFSNETYEKAMSQFLVDDSSEDDENSRKAVRDRTLASLGLSVRRPDKKKEGSIEEKDDEPSNESTKDPNPTQETMIDLEDEQVQSTTNLTDLSTDDTKDDIGESMAFLPTSASTSDTSQRDKKASLPGADPLDRNMALVESFKKKETGEKKKKSKKRKELRDAPKEKKKKKKKSKGDYFDDLFD